MHPFTKKVFQYLQKNQLTRPRQTILVGVSGGADSIALLCALNDLKLTLGVRLIVGHIDHQLRAASKADAKFVEKICRRMNVPFINRRVRIRAVAKKSSLEERAREARLKALISLAKECHADTIALAHQRDDLAETVLMRILRGSGLEGLKAIQSCNHLNGFRFIRPLLGVYRLEVEKFLKGGKILFRNDATNHSDIFLRNKIRRKLIPLLKNSYQTKISNQLAQLAETSALDYDFLEKTAAVQFKKCCNLIQRNQIEINLATLSRCHRSLQRMILRMCYEKLKGDKRRLDISHLEEIEDLILRRSIGATVHLPASIRVQKTTKKIIWRI